MNEDSEFFICPSPQLLTFISHAMEAVIKRKCNSSSIRKDFVSLLFFRLVSFQEPLSSNLVCDARVMEGDDCFFSGCDGG